MSRAISEGEMADCQVRSLGELYECYAGPVFGYLLQLSGQRALADELTGETFFRALLALDGFRGEASVKTWLLRIAHNLYIRRAHREGRTTSLEALEARGVVFAAAQPSPELQVLQAEQGETIQQALLSLPEGERALLLLSADAEMPLAEMAQVLDISVTAVKVRLYRARRRLAAALAERGISLDEGVRRC